jgi:hypothetical protein
MRNTSSRSRNGTHSLNGSLSRGLSRRCSRWPTTLLAGARRPRRPNDLLLACRLLSQYIRLRQRAAREDPHIFGPHAPRYFLETLAREQHDREVRVALDKVYGPSPPGQPARVSTLWTDRYFYEPDQHKRFLKWFYEHHPRT